ncbi:PAS domain S-box protein [Chroococcidiopsis sp.]|uniref:PAS domain S-box protein n=1 Tax=Chroococcidiopsis sp. TaxID=3088168 RepID=UPI003F31BD36
MSFERTVLIVDDSPEDRETYRRFLLADDRYHYIFLEADYGENGLEVCKLVQPDAILLDFHLPDIDGIEFLCELKTQFGKIQLPVIMLTGRGNEDVAVQAMKSGAADYLVKGKTTSENLRLAIHNILERDRLQQQLEQSEDRFRTSIENMLDCFGIYKSRRNESGKIIDFIVEYVNAAACTNNRMTAAEQIGKNLCEILPSHRQTGLFEEYCQVVETGKPLIKEALIYSDRFNQEYLTRAFDIHATKLDDGFVAAWRDITSRKQAEERLRLLESVVVNANDAVIITAIAPIEEPGPRIVYVNQAFTNLSGYTCEEVVGRSPRFLQGAKTDKAALKRIRDALEARQAVQEELINYRKDGSEFWVDISITPIADAAGQYTHFVAIQRDISDRKQSEVENARMLELAQQAQIEAEAANRAKDEFVAMVSHDLRSPLNAILGWAKLLKTRRVNAETAARALDAIERNAQSQAKLLEDLLDVSRMIRGKLELKESQFDLVSLVEESVETTFLAASAKQIHLEFGIQNSAVGIIVSGDRDRLQQVLGNLLSNAIKFTPEGGKIKVQLSLAGSREQGSGQRARFPRHRSRVAGSRGEFTTHHSYAQIQVIDTGNGISPEFLPHVFDRFRQAQSPNKQGGLGLGLAIARHIVELHGGTIHAASLGVGHGATFTIQLPLMPPK